VNYFFFMSVPARMAALTAALEGAGVPPDAARGMVISLVFSLAVRNPAAQELVAFLHPDAVTPTTPGLPGPPLRGDTALYAMIWPDGERPPATNPYSFKLLQALRALLFDKHGGRVDFADPQLPFKLEALTQRGVECRELGAFYTPPPLARYVLSRVLPLCPVGLSAPFVDPCVGAGHFLSLALQHLCACVPPGPLRADVCRTRIRGADINPAAVDYARFALALVCYVGCGEGPLYRDAVLAAGLLDGVRCTDSLTAPLDALFTPGCVVLTNPPWDRMKAAVAATVASMPERYTWRGQSRCEMPNYYKPFLELVVFRAQATAVGIVLPASLLTNPQTRHIRTHIWPHLREVVRFPDRAVWNEDHPIWQGFCSLVLDLSPPHSPLVRVRIADVAEIADLPPPESAWAVVEDPEGLRGERAAGAVAATEGGTNTLARWVAADPRIRVVCGFVQQATVDFWRNIATYTPDPERHIRCIRGANVARPFILNHGPHSMFFSSFANSCWITKKDGAESGGVSVVFRQVFSNRETMLSGTLHPVADMPDAPPLRCNQTAWAVTFPAERRDAALVLLAMLCSRHTTPFVAPFCPNNTVMPAIALAHAPLKVEAVQAAMLSARIEDPLPLEGTEGTEEISFLAEGTGLPAVLATMVDLTGRLLAEGQALLACGTRFGLEAVRAAVVHTPLGGRTQSGIALAALARWQVRFRTTFLARFLDVEVDDDGCVPTADEITHDMNSALRLLPRNVLRRVMRTPDAKDSTDDRLLRIEVEQRVPELAAVADMADMLRAVENTRLNKPAHVDIPYRALDGPRAAALKERAAHVARIRWLRSTLDTLSLSLIK